MKIMVNNHEFPPVDDVRVTLEVCQRIPESSFYVMIKNEKIVQFHLDDKF